MREITSSLTSEQIVKIDEFALAMVPNHRAHRTGGIKERNDKEIFENVKRGKGAEFSLFNYLISKNVNVIEEPNLEVMKLGHWDDGYDLTVQTPQGLKWRIDVKASDMKAHNLLLESDDWKLTKNKKNIEKTSSNTVPSFWFAVNFDNHKNIANIHGYLPKKSLYKALLINTHFYSQGEEIPNTSTTLDASNYIWSYKELFSTEDFISFYRNC